MKSGVSLAVIYLIGFSFGLGALFFSKQLNVTGVVTMTTAFLFTSSISTLLLIKHKEKSSKEEENV